MAASWGSARISDVATVSDFVANGSFASLRSNVTYRSAPDYAILVRLVDHNAGWSSDFVYVDKASYEFLRKSALVPGDIVIANVGANAGTVFRVPDLGRPTTLGPNAVVCRPRDDEYLDKTFLYYYFLSVAGQRSLRSIISGSAQPKFNKTDLRAVVIPIPPLAEQRAIAHILGTVDRKIELNRRMSETLEATARALFKSWFVDFDPVRTNAAARLVGRSPSTAELFPDTFEASEAGEIPKGWHIGRLSDVATNPRRGVQTDAIAPGTPYIGLEHIPKRRITLSDWGVSDGLESNKFIFRRGEILFGKLRPYFHKVGVAPVDGVCSTDIAVIAPKSAEWMGFVLGHVSDNRFVEHANAGATGTKMPRTKWSEMSQYRIVLPPPRVAEAFNSRLQPAVSRMIAGIHESRALATLRDRLLPKLISGELRVKDAERFVDEVG